MCHCSNMGVEQTQSKSQHRQLTLEKKILLPGLKPATFRSRVWRSTNKLSWIPHFVHIHRARKTNDCRVHHNTEKLLFSDHPKSKANIFLGNMTSVNDAIPNTSMHATHKVAEPDEVDGSNVEAVPQFGHLHRPLWLRHGEPMTVVSKCITVDFWKHKAQTGILTELYRIEKKKIEKNQGASLPMLFTWHCVWWWCSKRPSRTVLTLAVMMLQKT